MSNRKPCLDHVCASFRVIEAEANLAVAIARSERGSEWEGGLKGSLEKILKRVQETNRLVRHFQSQDDVSGEGSKQ